MNFIQIINISIPIVWIAALVALLVASILHRVLTGNKVQDWYWNGFFLYFIIWKLSYIFFHLNLFIKSPFSILYFNGGIKGHILALTTLSIYLFLSWKRYHSLSKEASFLYILYFICFELTVSLLEKSIIESISHIILLIVFFLLLKKNNKLLSDQLFILITLLEILIISTFHSALSINVGTFIWIGIIILILLKRKNKEGANT